MPTKLTTEILTAAIEGFEIQKGRIDAQIAEIRQLLEGSPAPAAVVASEKPSSVSRVSTKRRKMSKAGRAAIAAAQRKRWADLKKEPAAAAAPPKKRKLSAAGRKAIIAATKKRWAAKRAEAAKQSASEA
jgi:hypothetical protein